jgi:hypothetical protein
MNTDSNSNRIRPSLATLILGVLFTIAGIFIALSGYQLGMLGVVTGLSFLTFYPQFLAAGLSTAIYSAAIGLALAAIGLTILLVAMTRYVLRRRRASHFPPGAATI